MPAAAQHHPGHGPRSAGPAAHHGQRLPQHRQWSVGEVHPLKKAPCAPRVATVPASCPSIPMEARSERLCVLAEDRQQGGRNLGGAGHRPGDHRRTAQSAARLRRLTGGPQRGHGVALNGIELNRSVSAGISTNHSDRTNKRHSPLLLKARAKWIQWKNENGWFRRDDYAQHQPINTISKIV